MITVEILSQPAHPSICRFVRSFGQHRVTLIGGSVITPLAARPDQFIEFYLGQRYRISVDNGPLSLTPQTAVVGPHSRPGLRLHMSGNIDVFTIRFQPTGFHRLFGVPMPSLADQGIAIMDVLGRAATGVDEAIRRADGFDARVAAAQHWFQERACERSGESRFDHAARLLVAARDRVRIDTIAGRSGLSPRQFQRRFIAEVGSRLNLRPHCASGAALAAKNRFRSATERPSCRRRDMPIRRTLFVIASCWPARRRRLLLPNRPAWPKYSIAKPPDPVHGGLERRLIRRDVIYAA